MTAEDGKVKKGEEGSKKEKEKEDTPEDEGDEEDDEEEDEDEDEEDPIDPLDTSREACANSKACSSFHAKFIQCEERVTSKSHTNENCTEEILDFFHCQDTCAAKGLFAKLK